MTNKEKLQITESSIVNTRKDLRGINRKLQSLIYHKENKDLCSKEELIQLEQLEDLLREIEYRINDKLFVM